MEKKNYSRYRDLVALELLSNAQAPFVKKNKRGEEEVTVDYTVWNSLENLEKAANQMHPDFKNLWKWVKKTYPFKEGDSVREQFLKTDISNLLFVLKYNLSDELNRWKEGLRQGNFFYNLPQ